MFNCSQIKFVAIILVLSVFLMPNFARPIFRLTSLTFRPQKQVKQVALFGYLVLSGALRSLVSMYAIHKKCFGDLYLWFQGRFLVVDPPPTSGPHCTKPTPPPPTPPPQSPPLHNIVQAVGTSLQPKTYSHRCLLQLSGTPPSMLSPYATSSEINLASLDGVSF